ncbi:MAG: hypothetical protein U0174_11480 [Polyangiaceae bacterium]
MTAEQKGRILYNFLDEALLGIEDAKGLRSRITLPGLLARLSCGESTSLTALQAHQQHPMHAFLVQLAAISLERSGESEIAHDEGAWRELLLVAAARDGGGPEAFALVVEDLSKPAFMQPPVPEGTLAGFKSEPGETLNLIDTLSTSKNHDVKARRVVAAQPEHWMYSLISLQTSQGVYGGGNYGIARMNSGFGNRPCVALSEDMSLTSRFAVEVAIALQVRSAISCRGFAATRSIGFLWCEPWDGTASLSFEKLDPYFIEICRRIRLGSSSDHTTLSVFRTGSDVPRVVGTSRGNTGDLWTPVSASEGTALSLSGSGFTYARVRDLLFSDGDWSPGAVGDPRYHPAAKYWLGQALVRGKGGTEGYHERWVPIPPKARSFFAKPESRQAAGKMAQSWVDAAANVRLKVLKPALLTLIQAAPAKLKFDDDRADAFLRRFEFAVDQIFFPRLFGTLELPPDESLAGFQRELFAIAKRELQTACGSVPLSAIRKHRSIAVAERVLDGAARKHLALAFPRREEEHQGVAS